MRSVSVTEPTAWDGEGAWKEASLKVVNVEAKVQDVSSSSLVWTSLA